MVAGAQDEALAPPGGQKLSDWRQVTWVLYVLYAVAPLTAGLSPLVAVLINHLKRAEVRGTPCEGHFRWQRGLFWWSLLWLVLGYLTMWWHDAGLVFFLGGLVWYVYRLARGLSCLNDGKPLPEKV
jgi:uncharacterized membrane protein